MKFKLAYLGVAAILSYSASANVKSYMELEKAKALSDVNVTAMKDATEGVVCVQKAHDGKFSYLAGKVYNSLLTGELDKEQQMLFEKFEATKEGHEVEYTYRHMKKVAHVKKFTPDVVCAYVMPAHHKK